VTSLVPRTGGVMVLQPNRRQLGDRGIVSPPRDLSKDREKKKGERSGPGGRAALWGQTTRLGQNALHRRVWKKEFP